MSRIELSLEKARDLAAQVVNEVGEDYVYHDNYDMETSRWDNPGAHGSGCRYEYQGQPCCLVGRILNKAGLSEDDLKSMDSDVYPIIRGNRTAANLVTADKATWAYLDILQSQQDNEVPWGEALRAAEERLNG